ncbi:hypothetical protein FXO38_15773 [Capsicum annuum]|nr:hypothetical protein FXO38_15773 [Capsicum annuum]
MRYYRHLADRVSDGMPRILNWFVKHRSTYKKVVLSNITPTVLEKSILQLPDFKSVDAVVNSIDLPATSQQECSHLSSDNELTLLRSDVKMNLYTIVIILQSFFVKLATSNGDNNGDNSKKKDDDTPNIGGIGDDQVDDPPNVGQQNVIASELDHISYNLMDDDELDWSKISDVEISKFTQPDKSVATIDAAGLVCDNVRKVDTNSSDNVKGIEENMVDASVMFEETPAILRRLSKLAVVGESPFFSKFDSGCGKVEGQSSKHIKNARPNKLLLFVKHPFVKSFMERIDDIKVTLQFNIFVARSLRIKYIWKGVNTVPWVRTSVESPSSGRCSE